ncbi:MAG TPA: YcgL domain-containing protein [Gammaproteobacteria bacterium]|nr:YcgL domain-containing protein [Gammaproteobacteria bacterium]
MNCYIYRCSAKQDMYIYLAEEDNFDAIDEELRSRLGELSFTMPLQLTPQTTLAKEDPEQVIVNLQSTGFHLQLPGATTIEELLSTMARQK